MTLKIYFCGSIRGGREDAQLYAKIISHLKSFGTVLTEHVGWDDVLESGRNYVDVLSLYKHMHVVLTIAIRIIVNYAQSQEESASIVKYVEHSTEV